MPLLTPTPLVGRRPFCMAGRSLVVWPVTIMATVARGVRLGRTTRVLAGEVVCVVDEAVFPLLCMTQTP